MKWFIFWFYLSTTAIISFLNKDAGFMYFGISFCVAMMILVIATRMTGSQFVLDLFRGLFEAIESSAIYSIITFVLTIKLVDYVAPSSKDKMYVELLLALLFGVTVPWILKSIRRFFH